MTSYYHGRNKQGGMAYEKLPYSSVFPCILIRIYFIYRAIVSKRFVVLAFLKLGCSAVPFVISANARFWFCTTASGRLEYPSSVRGSPKKGSAYDPSKTTYRRD